MEHWEPLETIGESGSEGGVILRDEASENCRITLEQCPDYFAVPCGIAGSFVHTAFCGPADHDAVYNSMKQEISAFCERDTSPEEAAAFYRQFAEQY